MSGHPPGLIGVIAQDAARYSAFGESLANLETPPGTRQVWRVGYQVAAQTNALVEALLATTDKRWLWILGDDHAFSPNLLTRLLDVDLAAGAPEILVPLCLTRLPPYRPVAFSGFAPDGRHRIPVDLDEHPDGGVIAIHSCGSAGMLIRREVFEQIGPPWFTSYEVSPVEMGEDVGWCDKAREAGYVIYCNLDAPLGHCVTGSVWPVRERYGWTRGFSLAGNFTIRMPKEQR